MISVRQVLDKIKKITGVEKFDDTKILIETDGNLPDDITLKYVAILITFVIKDGGKFYQQLLSEEALVT